jgi:cellulose synthase/poly-beta-1,6-N-acetylglucosamine synthase-like glycosyltransferase
MPPDGPDRTHSTVATAALGRSERYGMSAWHDTVLMVYFALLGLLSLYGAHRYVLMILYYRHRRDNPTPAGRFPQPPTVTVQLPLFNEATVVERLLETVAHIDWPRDRLEVQVLDDSTDETQELARRKVEELRARGLDARYVGRSDRSGFKAGALAKGLETARGEFVAIFDADFLPGCDVLKRTIDYFTDRKVGMVQVRWGHLNRDYSLLTRLQSMLLDGHFVIEHTARHRSGRHFNFNGTAGVWRRAAILDAGGWQHDTLTEDLDLSYRAQMKGWRFVYLRDVTAPGELPVEMAAFKAQQHRWAKGSIQTGLKVLPRIWRSDLPFKVKSEATFHLTANLSYVLLLAMCVLMLPALNARLAEPDRLRSALFDWSVFVLATASVLSFYVAAQREIDPGWKRGLKYLPGVLALGIGLAVNNARAVIEALCSYETPFVRTPKYNVTNERRGAPVRRYRSIAGLMPWVEVAFGLYMGAIVWVGLQHRLWMVVFFMTLFAIGFLYVGIGSLWPARGEGRSMGGALEPRASA